MKKAAACKRRTSADVTEIQTPDDQTVIFVTKQPLAIFLDRLAQPFTWSAKSPAISSAISCIENLVGTGPYKFVSFQRGGNMVFTRNDDYWGGKAAIKEIVFRKVTEDAARLAALESGQADFINDVPVHEVARLQRHPRIRVDKIEGLEMYFLMMNVAYKPFDNKLVRQAINYCCRCSGHRQKYFRRHRLSDSMVRSDAHVIGADPKLKRYPYDPQKAKQLLAQAGYPNGCDVPALLFRRPLSQRPRSLPGRRGADGQRRISSGTDLAGMGAVLGTGQASTAASCPSTTTIAARSTDADTFYDQYFRTGTTKRCNYSNPAFDKLIDEEQQ